MLLFLAMCDKIEQKDKLERIYIKYRQKVFAWARDIVKNEARAEDITQDVFLILTRQEVLDCVHEENDEKTLHFLATITRHTSYNEYHTFKRIVPLNEFQDYLLPAVDDKEFKEMLDNIYLADLLEIIRKISSRYADVLILKYVDELDNRQIAAALNISEDNVRKRIERGKAQIRKHYQEREKKAKAKYIKKKGGSYENA